MAIDTLMSSCLWDRDTEQETRKTRICLPSQRGLYTYPFQRIALSGSCTPGSRIASVAALCDTQNTNQRLSPLDSLQLAPVSHYADCSTIYR
jgi:hypothetical protein